MRRRAFLQGLGLAVSPALAPALQSRSPNIVLVITDDQGYGDLGCHGNEKIRTPNLDRFAKQSIELTQFYVSPVCAPTRSSLMTGRYNYRTGVTDTYLGRAMMFSDEVTLPEMLAAAGYRTGIFGKWHLGDNYPLRSIDQGFQESLVHTGGGIGQPSDPPGNAYFDPILQHNGKPEKHKGYCTDIFTNAAMEFVEKSRGQPFFAYLATNAPHTPLQIDEAHLAPYKVMGLDDATARVYAMVSNIDENFGRLLGKLKALDLERDTIVIFMTDNGPQEPRFNAGMRGRKGTVYEGGIRVPFFIRWPGTLESGKQIDRIAAHIDIVPTLLDACGVGVSASRGKSIDGMSLMPLLRSDRVDWPDRTLYFQWHRGDVPQLYRSCAARRQRYKLVNGKELYDMAADPREQTDIAAKNSATVARMRKGYEDWFRDVSATRGYDPPRIQIGTKFENPVTLTRQDWRGPRAGWESDSLGYWEVEVTQAGDYEITLRFPPANGPAKACFQSGTLVLEGRLEKGAVSHKFSAVTLKAGSARFEPFLKLSSSSVGVHYVDVRRLS